nr:ATP-binding cassette domain-containing protein [Rhodococcus qingshengii]
MHPLHETGQLPPGPMALQVEHLCMAFGAKVAVNDLSLAVPSGSLFGLVGPNGAGKTTTLSMAVGLLRPHYGRSLVYGYDVWNDPVAAKSLLGVLPDGLALPAQFTGHELLTYFGRLRGMSEDVIASRRDELLAALDLADAGGTVIADYSAGMTKKIGLASALLHGPRLLVLDEPFEAVDPISSAGIRSILLSFVHSGGSVILSSHVMALVEQLCTHIGVIADGRVVASGTVDEVRAGNTLDEAFVRLVGSRSPNPDGLSWMRA